MHIHRLKFVRMFLPLVSRSCSVGQMTSGLTGDRERVVCVIHIKYMEILEISQ